MNITITPLDKIFTRLMVLALSISMIQSAIIFNTAPTRWDNTVIPQEKDKYLDRKVYEDKTLTTKVSLVLSDGVGGWKFTSAHMAKLIVNQASRAIITNYMNHQTYQSAISANDKFSRTFSGFMYDAIQEYNRILLDEFQAFLVKKDREFDPRAINNANLEKLKQMNLSAQSFTLGGAGTLMAAYIEQSQRPKLRLTQMGDSLAMLMRRKSVNNFNKSYYYVPEFITGDMQRQFNAPPQITMAFG